MLVYQRGTKNIPTYISVTLATILSIFISYIYMEAFFGRATKFEMLFVIGINSAFVLMNASQWFLTIDTKCRAGEYIMNHIFKLQFKYLHGTHFIYEVFCLCLATAGVLYPFLYLPCLYGVSWFMPGMMTNLLQGIDYMGNNPLPLMAYETPSASTIKFFVFLIISMALGHGVVNLAITAHWLYTYHFTVLLYLKSTRW